MSQLTATWICSIVYGIAMAAGVYVSLTFQGLIDRFQSTDPSTINGTFASERHSVNSDELTRGKKMVATTTLKVHTPQRMDAIIFRGKGGDLNRETKCWCFDCLVED
jgi:hypothetical protein